MIPTSYCGVKDNHVRAPLPGVIKEVFVTQGEKTAYGQELCVIEAMKMRNTIRSSREGIIAEVTVSPGQTVNHDDILIKFLE